MLKQNCLKSKIVTLATLLNWLVSECVLFQSTVESNMKLNAVRLDIKLQSVKNLHNTGKVTNQNSKQYSIETTYRAG